MKGVRDSLPDTPRTSDAVCFFVFFIVKFFLKTDKLGITQATVAIVYCIFSSPRFVEIGDVTQQGWH